MNTTAPLQNKEAPSVAALKASEQSTNSILTLNPAGAPRQEVDAQALYEGLRAVHQLGEFFEIRSLGAGKRAQSAIGGIAEDDGRDDFSVYKHVAQKNISHNIFHTINPLVQPAPGGYDRDGKYGPYKSCTARDEEVLRLRWIPYDLDPLRLDPSGKELTGSVTSATDAEKAGAWEIASKVLDYWRNAGFDPTVIDSANGYQVLVPADLPKDSKEDVKRLLEAHAAKWDLKSVAHVDTSVFNPSRVLALPGTWKKKGTDTPERPWRMVKLLHAGTRNAEVRQ